MAAIPVGRRESAAVAVSRISATVPNTRENDFRETRFLLAHGWFHYCARPEVRLASWRGHMVECAHLTGDRLRCRCGNRVDLCRTLAHTS